MVETKRLSPSANTIGVVGCGRMGAQIGRWLIDAGWKVRAADVSDTAAAGLEDQGADRCASLGDVAAEADLVFVVVVDDDQVREVVTGPQGILATARPGTILAVSSSIDPLTCRDLAKVAARQGVQLVDAALVGGEHAAQNASLTLMCGGDLDALRACQPAFAAFAVDVCWAGPVGSGQVAKMVNNMLLWANLRADYEALRFARALGVEPGTLRPIIASGSGANRALADWALHNKRRPGRGLPRMVAMAKEHGIDMPLFSSLADICEDDEMVLDDLR